MNRRKFLILGGAAVLSGNAGRVLANSSTQQVSITTRAGNTRIVGPDFPATEVWGVDGKVPGVPIRCVHGQALDENYPDTVDAILKAGHEIGHHSWRHEDPMNHSDEEEAELFNESVQNCWSNTVYRCTIATRMPPGELHMNIHRSTKPSPNQA